MKKNDPIYTVTTINLAKTHERNEKLCIRVRTVGYYHDLKTAQECLEENWGDLEEAGWYTEAVIEEVLPGLYPVCLGRTRWYYKFKYNDPEDPKAGDGNWVECDPFPWHEEVVNYCELG